MADFLTAPSSASRATAVTGETGTGALVFGTGPTLTGATLAGALDGDGYETARKITRVVTSVRGTLITSDHSGMLRLPRDLATAV